MPASKSPFDAVRGAFSELDASEKTAFVLEATFAAVAEGLAETGRRLSAAVRDIDDLFTAPHRERPVVDPEAMPKTAPAPEPSAPKRAKPSAPKPPPAGGKTAGRAQPPDDDA